MAEETFVDRLVAEGDQLAERLDKLSQFLTSDKFGELSEMEQAWLNIQVGAMTAYLTVLRLRIAHYVTE